MITHNDFVFHLYFVLFFGIFLVVFDVQITLYCFLLFAESCFHSEGHMAILYHEHALGSKMDMPVAIIAPSCP